jgi:cysteine desulfurase
MIYLDNNATTPVAPEVAAVMAEALRTSFVNPSSAYSASARSRAVMRDSREQVAALLGAKSAEEVVFTSGGTESDNWGILGALGSRPGKRHVVTTAVEHEAVRRLCERLSDEGYEVSVVGVDREGALDLDVLSDALRDDTAVVSVMLANNETGVLFPIDEVARRVKARCGALVHVDGVNAVGKIPIALGESEVDLFSISAHKFHGPKGIGALYIRSGVGISPMMVGGGQESARRAGTEAVHQIAGIGKAAEMASDLTAMEQVRGLRDLLEDSILTNIPNAGLNGLVDRALRLPNTSNISFAGINGEAVLARLDEEGICVSTGSACNSADHSPSAVLQAMGVPYHEAMGAVRFSLGRYNTRDEVDAVSTKINKIVGELLAVAGHR